MKIKFMDTGVTIKLKRNFTYLLIKWNLKQTPDFLKSEHAHTITNKRTVDFQLTYLSKMYLNKVLTYQVALHIF